MKKLSTLLILALLVSMSAMATKNSTEKSAEETAQASPATMNSISGKIVDFSTGESLAGVRVVLEGSQQETFTDFDGNFTFNNLNVAEAKVSASFISYENASVNIDPSTGQVKLSLKSAF